MQSKKLEIQLLCKEKVKITKLFPVAHLESRRSSWPNPFKTKLFFSYQIQIWIANFAAHVQKNLSTKDTKEENFASLCNVIEFGLWWSQKKKKGELKFRVESD